jgi:RNA polymerase sigma factor (sigma-70 family)
MMSNPSKRDSTVFIVDDDAAMRDSLVLMLGLLGYRTASFESAESFLAAYREDWTGCVVADLKLTGMSGLDLQAELCAKGSRLPFVVITGHGDVASARTAFRSNAVDFLEKPFDEGELQAAIEKGLASEARRIERAEASDGLASKLADLTPREREVLELVGKGLHAKEIASALDISPRTVEVHKARLMAKLDARNVSELVRFAVFVEGPGAAHDESRT